jgi:hypothetical protein
VGEGACNNGVAEKGRKGATRGMSRFSDEDPDMEHYFKYLRSMDGGLKDVEAAKAIVSDVSKILYYLNPREVEWALLTDERKLMR